MDERAGGVGKKGWAKVVLALILGHGAGAASAETLYDAIAMAYQGNPALRAQRAALRATDEAYVQARAGYGPTLNFSGSVQYQVANVDQQTYLGVPAGDQTATTGTADLALTEPLYTGGRVRAQVEGAAAQVQAGRETLRQAEGETLQNVITAYMDVRRDREALRIVRAEIDTLAADDREVSAKGALGQVTRTDVAQAEARWLAARAQLPIYQGRLQASSAEYLNVVGANPGELAPEPDLPGIPPTLDAALDSGEADNPQLLAAIGTERAARAAAAEARSADKASLSARVDLAVGPVVPYDHRIYDRSATAELTLNQPIFTGGLNASRVREAAARDERAALDVETARRNAIQSVTQGWDQLAATRAALALQRTQADAEALAVKGNRIEERVGARTVIDLLNAEQELVNTRLTLSQNAHDEYLARAALLYAMGALTADKIAPSVASYDPQASFRQVNRAVVPWTGAVQALDGLGAPHAAAPNVGPSDGVRPVETPSLPPEEAPSASPAGGREGQVSESGLNLPIAGGGPSQ